MDEDTVLQQLRRISEQQGAQAELYEKVKQLHERIQGSAVDELAYEHLRQHYQDCFTDAAAELETVAGATEALQLYITERVRRDELARLLKERGLDGADSSSAVAHASGADRLPSSSSAAAAAAAAAGATTASINYDAIRRVARKNVWDHSTYVLESGQFIAALTDPNSKPRLWIMARVKKYVSSRGRERYQVVDDEDDNNPIKKVYTLDADRVVPLYTLEEVPLDDRRIFKANTRVLAHYPDTTVFYPCIVIRPPVVGASKRGGRRRSKNGSGGAAREDKYVLMFDDDDERQLEIDASLVFPFPKGMEE